MTTSAAPHYRNETFAHYMKQELANWNICIHASAYGESTWTLNGKKRTWWAVVSGGHFGEKVAVQVVTWNIDRGWFTYKEHDAADFGGITVPTSIREKVRQLGLDETSLLPATHVAA